MKGYPVVKEDIFFAKYTGSGLKVRIRNTTTEKDFRLSDDTVALLDLCTGARTVDEIINTLSINSGEPFEEVARDVYTILEILQEKDILSVNETPLKGRKPAKILSTYAPETAQIEVTNKCNLSCLHCFNNSGEPCLNELTTDEILSLIDVLSSMGVNQLTLTGGEPFLHPDLFTIVEHARKAPMTVTIFTNGTLITEEHVKKCKELTVKFAVSVDSCNAATHDRFRGKKGALERTLHSIKLLKEAGFSVRISVSLSQLNKDELIDTLTYFNEHNLTDYQVAEVSVSGRGINEVTITPDEYYQALISQLNYEKGVGNLRKIAPKQEGGCGIAQNLIYIKADGTILPCHACNEDMGVGNVRDVNLVNFWDTNEILEMLRKVRAENDNKCRGCHYLNFCDGCIGNAFIFEKRICTYDPYACARHKVYEAVGLLGR